MASFAVVVPLVAILLTAIVLWIVRRLRRRYIELRKAGHLQKLKDCIRQTNDILFPMSVMFANDFTALGKMLAFEDAQHQDLLKIYFSTDEI